jgi:4'-phosphopantetheinyl transferase
MTNAVQLRWLEQTQADVPFGDEWLTEAERCKMRSFRIEKRRNDWRLGRWTAKRAVAAYLRWPIEDVPQIEIRAEPSGAPAVIIPHQQAPPAISISHCDHVALCVVGPPGAAFGCDLERVEARNASFAETFFTAPEQEKLQGLHGDELAVLETLIWSAKESYLKATRQGLRRDTREVEVEIAEDVKSEIVCQSAEWQPLTVHAGTLSAQGFWLSANHSLLGQEGQPLRLRGWAASPIDTIVVTNERELGCQFVIDPASLQV